MTKNKSTANLYIIFAFFFAVGTVFSVYTYVASGATFNICDQRGVCLTSEITQDLIDSYTSQGLIQCQGTNCVAINSEAMTRLSGGQTPDAVQDTSPSNTYGCSGFTASLCIAFYDSIYWIISLPVTLSALYLYIAGTLFDNSIAFTISNFSANYASLFAAGVDTVWASFRDVGNIIMIGVFVYIAFRTMLGMESFEMKSFAARLMIVAVLINFSLFFTKIIIDISNITAVQFLRGMSVPSASIVPGASGNVTSIATTFADRAGLKGTFIESAADVVRNIGANEKLPGGATFRYVFLTTIFFLAVGSVLLYGSILLITRMVALVLIMVTSSFAWVAYMTPKLDKYWTMWWDKMIKYALFAPLYMLLLWATLKITESMGAQAGATATSQTLLALSTSGNIFTAFIRVAVIVGLLYGATKIADELSIAGAKAAKKVSMRTLGMGLTATGITSGAALLGRTVVGQSAGKMRDLQASMATSNSRLARSLSDLAGGAKLNKALDGLAKSQFQLRDTKLAGGLLGKKPDEKANAEFLAKNVMKKAEAQAKNANKTFKKGDESAEKDPVDEARMANASEAAKAAGTEAGKAAGEALKEAQVGASEPRQASAQQGTTAPKPNIMEQMARGSVPPSQDAQAKAGAGAGETAREAQKIAQVAENIAERTAAQNQKQPSAKDLAKAEGAARLDHMLNTVLGKNRKPGKSEIEQAEEKAIANAAREIAKTNVEGMNLNKSLKEAVLKQISSGGKSDFDSALGKISDQFKELEKKTHSGSGGGDHGKDLKDIAHNTAAGAHAAKETAKHARDAAFDASHGKAH